LIEALSASFQLRASLIAVRTQVIIMSNLVSSDGAIGRWLQPVVRYIRDTRAEIAKVAWPSIEQTRNLSLIVIGVTVAMSVALGLADFVFSKLIENILRLVGQ
jgi:preprotein translocase SecE subunit